MEVISKKRMIPERDVHKITNAQIKFDNKNRFMTDT